MTWEDVVKRLEQRVPFIPQGGVLEVTLEEYNACVRELQNSNGLNLPKDFKLWLFRGRQLKLL